MEKKAVRLDNIPNKLLKMAAQVHWRNIFCIDTYSRYRNIPKSVEGKQGDTNIQRWF